MFLRTELELPLCLDDARVALDRAVADGGLVAESRHAYSEGRVFLMRVGPGGGHGMAKQVVVRVLPGRWNGRTLTVPLRWEATGPAGRLFPVFDADLQLCAATEDTAMLTITGTYVPPLGAVGDRLDHALLSGIAQRTLDALGREVADRVQVLAAAASGYRPGDPSAAR